MKEKIDLNLWRIEKRKISEIIPNPRNPRVITEKSIKGVRNSILKNGYVDKIAINTDNMICSGHARYLVLKDILGDDAEIDCYVPARTLSEKEVDQMLLGMNAIGGMFDIEALQLNFDPVDLDLFDIKFDIDPIKEVNAPEIADEKPDNNTITLNLTNAEEVNAPEIADEKPDNNTITLNLTNAEFEIVNEAVQVARDNLEIDPNSKPIPGPIVAICKEFLALIDDKNREREE